MRLQNNVGLIDWIQIIIIQLARANNRNNQFPCSIAIKQI